MLRWLPISLVAFALAACPRSDKPPTPPDPTAGTTPDRDGALKLPAPAEAAASLEALDRAADQGDIDAAWTRLHYLLDLFDDARFRKADDSLALLASALGRGQGGISRGPAGTDAAVAALTVEADRVLALDRMHPGAVAARTLLDLERTPPADRAQLFHRTVAAKRIARSDGPLAQNARLRLFGMCHRAFADAWRQPLHRRLFMISFCLYPLYDADPEPYFERDAARRPPAPRWRDLADRLSALGAEIRDGGGRLALTGASLLESWQREAAEREADMPPAYDPRSLGVPTVDRAEAYDQTRLLPLGDGRAVHRDRLEEAFRVALRADDRAAGAIALYADALAGPPVYAAAGVLADLGAHFVQLAVGLSQRLEAPPGDYWHERIEHGQVDRVGVISVALDVLRPSEPPSGAAPLRDVDWDPRRASLGLTLSIEADRWRLTSSDGELNAIATSAAPAAAGAALRQQLKQVRLAFPEEEGLMVAVGGSATYGDVVTALSAAARDSDGQPLFPRLALAPVTAPVGRSSARLRERIERRWRAAVALAPEVLSARAPQVRRCYQEALESAPELAGSLRIELRAGEPRIASGPRARELRRCVLRAVGPTMKASQIASADIGLSLAE